jgi:hypothetical protein
MESLGGDIAWVDRFVAQHSAIFYYWAVMALYAVSPKNAYQFSELVEGHATDTYQGGPCCHVLESFASSSLAVHGLLSAVCASCSLHL